MKITALAAVLLSVGMGVAQGQVAVVPSPNLAGIAHVAIRVKSLDAAVAFYEGLGFVKAFALSRDGAVYEAFIKINDRQFIELYPVDAKNTQIGFLHLCFEGGDLNAVHDYYVSKGLTPSAVKTAGAGNLLFTMPGPVTPTGPQNMEYTQYMPGSLHSKDFGQHLGASRVGDAMVNVTLAMSDPDGARAFYLNKAGFVAEAGGKLALPGGSGRTVEIVPVAELGMKARISLHAMDAAKVGTKLVDPDGNEILLVK